MSDFLLESQKFLLPGELQSRRLEFEGERLLGEGIFRGAVTASNIVQQSRRMAQQQGQFDVSMAQRMVEAERDFQMAQFEAGLQAEQHELQIGILGEKLAGLQALNQAEMGKEELQAMKLQNRMAEVQVAELERMQAQRQRGVPSIQDLRQRPSMRFRRTADGDVQELVFDQSANAGRGGMRFQTIEDQARSKTVGTFLDAAATGTSAGEAGRLAFLRQKHEDMLSLQIEKLSEDRKQAVSKLMIDERKRKDEIEALKLRMSSADERNKARIQSQITQKQAELKERQADRKRKEAAFDREFERKKSEFLTKHDWNRTKEKLDLLQSVMKQYTSEAMLLFGGEGGQQIAQRIPAATLFASIRVMEQPDVDIEDAINEMLQQSGIPDLKQLNDTRDARRRASGQESPPPIPGVTAPEIRTPVEEDRDDQSAQLVDPVTPTAAPRLDSGVTLPVSGHPALQSQQTPMNIGQFSGAFNPATSPMPVPKAISDFKAQSPEVEFGNNMANALRQVMSIGNPRAVDTMENPFWQLYSQMHAAYVKGGNSPERAGRRVIQQLENRAWTVDKIARILQLNSTGLDQDAAQQRAAEIWDQLRERLQGMRQGR